MAISSIGGSTSTPAGSGSSFSAPQGMGVVAGGFSSTGYYSFTPKANSAHALSSWGIVQNPSNASGRASFSDSLGNVYNTVAVGTAVAAADLAVLPSTATGFVHAPWNFGPTFSGSNVVVRYFNGVYLAGTATGNVYSSTDAITWTLRYTFASGSAIAEFAWNGTNLFMAATSGVGNNIATSPDGITWTLKTATNSVNSLTYGNGYFVALCSGGTTTTVIYTSPDGTTWTARTVASASNGAGLSIAWNGSLFVYTTSSSASTLVVHSSPDAVTWTQRTAAFQPTVSAFTAVTWANGKWWATGTGATANLMTSTDGATWTIQPMTSGLTGTTTITGLVYFNSAYWTMDNTGYVWSSTDASNWVRRGRVTNAPPTTGVTSLTKTPLAVGTKLVAPSGAASGPQWSSDGLTGSPMSFAVFSNSAATIN